MADTTERFVVNGAGDRVAVLIEVADYLKLLDAAEELESIHAFEAAKSTVDVEVIPFEQAVREIEHARECALTSGP